jgi:ParB-like chromosome segregation protein Spo0J
MHKKVKIDEIRIDGKTQHRLFTDQNLVYQYLADMKNGDEFPPIKVMYDQENYWLFSGFHRYNAFKLLGLKEVQTEYHEGTLDDARRLALKENSDHGRQLTPEEKRNKVIKAEEDLIGGKDMTDVEIAKICSLSKSFVGSVRRPEVKEKQRENKKKHAIKTAKKELSDVFSSPTTAKNPPDDYDGSMPDEDELRSVELATQKYLEEIDAVMRADDKLAEANATIKRLTNQIVQNDLRFNGLMNEKLEAVKMVKDLQRQLDKLKGKK